MIVCTAGHVDHGKTALVRALTGIDTDRLPEERRRGLTIEPGFAHADLGGGEPVDFVDLPGHERFVRHMLAGVSGADAALLVIAADDGPMPQTREHLAVLDLIGLSRGAVALTKIDRVSPARVAELTREIDALLGGTSLAGAQTVPLSNVTGAGLDVLRRHLGDLQRTLPARIGEGAARFTIDRVFSRPGAGLVVTGTLLSGRVATGDALRVSPSCSAVRVRGLQVHGRAMASVRAGQRCALNLVPLANERLDLDRGDWLVAPALHAPSTRIDIDARWLAEAPRALAADTTLQVHLGATMRTARAVPLSPRCIEPGARGLVQLVLDQPVCALHGDRLVLRDAAAQRIVGGGSVLDPWAPARGRAQPERLTDLGTLAEPEAAAALQRLVATRADGIDWTAFARARNLDAEAWRGWPDTAALVAVPQATGLRLVAPVHWQALTDRIVDVLAAAHAAQPDAVGLAEATLLRSLGPSIDIGLRRAALRAQLQAEQVVRDGFVLRRPDHIARLSADDDALLARVVPAMLPAGLRPIPPGELAPLLDLPLKDLSAFLERAAALGHLVQIAKNRFFLPSTIQALVDVARDCAAASEGGRFDAKSFRDRSGIGRNLTIQVLEFFDRSGLTRYANERRTMALDREP